MAGEVFEEKTGAAAELEPRNGKVLVVDDSPPMLSGVTSVLEELGDIQADSAENAEQALQLLATNSYAGLILDGLNGDWELIARKGLALGIKVVWLHTSDDLKYKDHELITSGQVRLVVKPASSEILLTIFD